MTSPSQSPPATTAPAAQPDINFEDLCLDPYQSNFDGGRDEGNIAGLQAGYDEGRKLGQQKALEVGIELGYMRGVATTIQEQVLPTMAGDEIAAEYSDTRRRVKKIAKSTDELISAIDGFPSPDEIFHAESSVEAGEGDAVDVFYGNDKEDSEEVQTSTAKTTGAVDISGKMQRIRAKFKLICVQLKMPELSLTKVMDAAKAEAIEGTRDEGTSAERISAPSIEGDQDW